jgi:glycosyltransferase involved in cell wall biosynthesis
MTDNLFSVIIPHKNSLHLLQRCLDSIPECNNVQVIVVDDDSDSDKVNFNAFPGFNRKNTEVYFTKEGKGAGYARNVGLKYAKGKWLLFADADDFFTENAFDILFKYIDSEYDILYFKVTSCYSDTYEKANRDKGVNSLIENLLQQKNKAAEDFIRYRHLPPWGKILKRDFILKNNILFEEVPAANDRMFSILSGHCANSIGIINKYLYCITVNKGSIAHTLSLSNLTSKYITTLRCNQFVRKANKSNCQYSILPDLILSRKLGFKVFLKFIKLAIHYKANPFVGFSRICSSSISWYKERIKNQKYIVQN